MAALLSSPSPLRGFQNITRTIFDKIVRRHTKFRLILFQLIPSRLIHGIKRHTTSIGVTLFWLQLEYASPIIEFREHMLFDYRPFSQ